MWLRVEIISTDFTNPPSKTEVSTRCFPTQCYVDVYKGELYVWIIQIIADKSEGFHAHAFVAVQWLCKRRQFPSPAVVAGVGIIVLQMPRNKSNSK